MASLRTIVVAALASTSGPALAQSLTGNVGSAGITAGERAAEFRSGVDDEGNVGARLHYDHAFTDRYQLRLIGAFRRPDGGDVEYSAFTVENWLQWAKEAGDGAGFNGGLRLAWTFAEDGGPDEAAVRLTLTDKFAGQWEWRANAIAAFEAGSGRAGGAELETRLQLTRAVALKALGSRKWRLGVEAFSEHGDTRDLPGLSDQAHQLGPVVKAEWGNGVYLQAAVRVGVTNGADDLMGKVFLGRGF
jgi:hypothetical protein